MKYYHEYSDKGQHRLGTMACKSTRIKWGKWVGYTEPAMLGQYVAVTDYYTGSAEFPDCNQLYQITPNVWPLIVVERP